VIEHQRITLTVTVIAAAITTNETSELMAQIREAKVQVERLMI
jgi:hypothetical protein